MKTPTTLFLSLLTLAACTLVSSGEEAAPAKGFDKKLSLQGVTFHVTCPNKGSVNNLQIDVKGLAKATDPVKAEIDGTVTSVEVADLNADGSPEIYVFTRSAGSGSYGNVIAYAANNKKSLSQVSLPELTDDAKASKGYMGHDEFAVVENVLARRFPLYQKGDSNAKPSGKTRQIQYKLHAGEAGWILRLEKFADY